MAEVTPRNARPPVAAVQTKSALNPALWFCAVISLPLFGISAALSGWKSDAVFAIACIPIVITCLLLMFYGFFRPKYLQSEGFQLRDRALTLFGDSARKNKDLGRIIEGDYVVTQEDVDKALEARKQ
jgi:hypothetical protein